MKIRQFILFVVSLWSSTASFAWAQADSTFVEAADSNVHALRLRIGADAFFIDNEYNSPTFKGYTLPGVRVRPVLTYDPLKDIHLELGAEALFFHGARHYPNYAYHDISSWKGHQYTSGLHVIPWFRTDASIGPATFTLGALHQRDTGFHDLALPLYNPECSYSADPEMGIEGRIKVSHYTLDAWVDWQSFIYKGDTHQEAFTGGVTQSIHFTPDAKKKEGLSVSMPLQVLFQHRGGEIDNTHTGAQTLCNLGGGLRAEWRQHKGVVRSAGCEILPMKSEQLSGNLWAKKHGTGVWGSTWLNLWDRADARLGYLWGNNFRSLYGAPFFHNGGIAHVGSYYVGYTQPFKNADESVHKHRFFLSFGLQGYIVNNAGQTNHSLSVCLAFHADMNFLLKRFAHN